MSHGIGLYNVSRDILPNLFFGLVLTSGLPSKKYLRPDLSKNSFKKTKILKM